MDIKLSRSLIASLNELAGDMSLQTYVRRVLVNHIQDIQETDLIGSGGASDNEGGTSGSFEETSNRENK